MMRRVSWSAVATLVFMILAFTSAISDETTLAYTFALCSIAWAVLSLKERT